MFWKLKKNKNWPPLKEENLKRTPFEKYEKLILKERILNIHLSNILNLKSWIHGQVILRCKILDWTGCKNPTIKLFPFSIRRKKAMKIFFRIFWKLNKNKRTKKEILVITLTKFLRNNTLKTRSNLFKIISSFDDTKSLCLTSKKAQSIPLFKTENKRNR